MKRLLWLFAPGGLLVLLLLSLSSPPQLVAQTSAQASELRFDGLYERRGTGKDDCDYLRFYEDLTVVGAATKCTPERVARWLNKTSDERGQYTVQGSQIEFSLKAPWGIFDYKGNIELDGLELELYSHPVRKRFSLKYQFVPLPEEVLREETVSEGSHDASVEVKLGGPSGDIAIRVTLGKVGPDHECESFTPVPAPAVFPVGTTTLAYEVSIEPPKHGLDVGIGIEAECESATKKGNRCNEYAIVDGGPVNNQWTSILSCGDGGPFKPGSYKLQVLFGGTPVKELPFDIK